MSNEVISISNDFAVARTSKKGVTTYRGVVGILSSGNKAERESLLDVVVERLIANNNYRHLMREVERVFSGSFMNKAASVTYKKGKDGAPDELWFNTAYIDKDGTHRRDSALYEGWTKANKRVAMDFARALIEIYEADGVAAPKGEKLYYYNALARMVEAEDARIAAQQPQAITA